MTEIQTLSFEEKLRQFGEALKQSEQNALVAGRLLVAMIDEQDDAVDQIMRRFNVPLTQISLLERIGRDKLHPMFAFSTSPAAEVVIKKRLCIEEQNRLASGGEVEVAVPDGNGGYEKTHRKFDELSRQTADQVIDDFGKPRSFEVQKGFLDSKIEAKRSRAQRYTVRDGVFVVQERMTLTVRDMLKMILLCKPSNDDIDWMQEQLKSARQP